MALRIARLRPGGRLFRLALVAALVGAAAACTPTIEAWRSASGIAKNDPDPATRPFTKNMADAATEPYPNLATVPPPPTRATSTAERQKLAQSLIDDRTATQAMGSAAPSAPAAPRPAAAPKPAAKTSGTATAAVP